MQNADITDLPRCIRLFLYVRISLLRNEEMEKKKKHIEDISRNGTGWTMKDDEDEIQDEYGDRIME